MSPDRMTDTLAALRTDVERVGLADSGSVRRRGERRTRNQAIGGTLAVACVVAGVVGVAGGLTGGNSAEAPPANPTITTTQDAEKTYALADDPFLQEGDLTGIGYVERFQRSTEWAEDQAVSVRCLIDPGKVGAAQVEHLLFYTDLDPTIRQHVLRFSDVESARGAVGKLTTGLAGCDQGDPAQIQVSDRGPEPVEVGDEAYRFARSAIPLVASEAFYAEVAIVREANVVIVLDLSSMGNPYGNESTQPVWDETRLAVSLDRAVAK